MTQNTLQELSEREREILTLLATGATNKEIAQSLYISPNTVKVHLRNIFGKIGVSTRTEAAMYAVKLGMVNPPDAAPPQAPVSIPDAGQKLEESVPASGTEILKETIPVASSSASETKQQRNFVSIKGIGLTLAFLLLVFSVSWLMTKFSSTTLAQPDPVGTLPVVVSRTHSLPPLPRPSASMASIVYQSNFYLIGGDTAEGISNQVLRYSIEEAEWSERANKPTAVTEIGAALWGGRIYVPGGRSFNGKIIADVEIYDPQENSWSLGAALPAARSAYALTMFEGRLYLFGGWDGQHYCEETFFFIPQENRWYEASPMPVAGAFQAAIVSGDQIFLFGGKNEHGLMADVQIYQPFRDVAGDPSWSEAVHLPIASAQVVVGELADSIYVIGGEKTDSLAPSWVYNPLTSQWREFVTPFDRRIAFSGGFYQTDLYVFGGKMADVLLDDVTSYQVLYTILLPVVQ